MVCCIGGNIFFEEKRAGDVMMWWERLKVKAKSRRERERATAEIGGGGGEANSKDTKNRASLFLSGWGVMYVVESDKEM